MKKSDEELRKLIDAISDGSLIRKIRELTGEPNLKEEFIKQFNTNILPHYMKKYNYIFTKLSVDEMAKYVDDVMEDMWNTDNQLRLIVEKLNTEVMVEKLSGQYTMHGTWN